MIYTLNLADNFADKLVDYILDDNQSILDLAQTQVILPTKRACKTLKDSFIKRCENQALLMPKLTALYDIDVLEEDVPSAISTLQRTIFLTRMCLLKPGVESLDKALVIALSLGQLLDEFYQYEASFEKIEHLVPNMDLAIHWNETVKFLDIIKTVWPEFLKNTNKIDEMDRKIRLINHFTQKIETNPPQTKIIMAGFDGALPCVSKLMNAINRAPKGVVLLHGFNNTLTKDDLDFVDDNHYQFGFKKLLSDLHLIPFDIKNISKELTLREEFVQEAFRPAEQGDEWRFLNLPNSVLEGVHKIECESINEEALTIALILRKTLETPEKTAALVTNDRLLARRVILEMKRWGVELDDSAGTPLHHTPIGVFLSLIAQVGKEKGSPSSILSLLKHPLSTDNRPFGSLRLIVKNAEKTAREKQTDLQIDLNTNLEKFIKIFEENKEIEFSKLLEEHLNIANQLAKSSDKTADERLWQNEVGETAFKFLVQLKQEVESLPPILPSSYPEIIDLFLSSISVRSMYGMHQRLDILGPIEARLSHPDVCVIAGLNENSFPRIPDVGPWLTRTMRKELKLPSIENKIASQELDFAHCFLSKEVYITRSLKSDGSQTIPSRFLSRLEATLQASNIKWEAEKPHLARLLDQPFSHIQIDRPNPKPPVETRPVKLSATNIELLMKNPYAIYAKYILKLYPLQEIENDRENLIYGSAVHKALEELLPNFNPEMEEETIEQLIIQKLEEFGLNASTIKAYAGKVKKIASFILNEQLKRYDDTLDFILEKEGQYNFLLNDKSVFTLTGKADRIDILKGNNVEIIDYKTGTPPAYKQIEQGLSPQMTLEGLIVQEKGFDDLQKKCNIKISYWQLSGSENKVVPVPSSRAKKSVEELIDEAKIGVKSILSQYRKQETPYEAFHQNKESYNDYALLSREKEWINANDMEEDS